MGLIHIASVTASASSSLAFTSGIDATYNEYQFHFVNIHPASDKQELLFQVNAAGESGFNETITSTFFYAYHNEGDSAAAVVYHAGGDKAQGTTNQLLILHIGNDDDQSGSGVLTLYAPSSTTYVKHFVARTNRYSDNEYTVDENLSGYINTTSAIDEIQFVMNSGNIDSGSIHMYGVG
jgi:hypothetical protein